MSILLHIDTAGETGMVCLSENGILLQQVISDNQKEHASFIHVAIRQLLDDTATDIKKLSAIVVTEGPGSYTGLRVGLSTAKGLCFGLQIPLITVNALELLAHASIKEEEDGYLFWPMIDARRWEVFTAIYKKDLSIVLAPTAMVLNEENFKQNISGKKYIFSGSGTAKIHDWLANTENFIYPHREIVKNHCKMGYEKFFRKDFSNILYAEPLYIKEFYDQKG